MTLGEHNGYWDKITQSRLGRRRVLATSAGVAAGAAFLAACGGSDKSPKAQSSSLVGQIVDESKSAKRGGQLIKYITEFQPFDPVLASALPLNRFYSRLFRTKGGYKEPTSGEVENDVAESYEFSPDKLSLTVKVSQKAHFAPSPIVAGVNGRVPDAADVIWSYQHLKDIGTNRGSLANDVNPGAPVTSVTSPDARTVVFKFVEPISTALTIFSPLPIMPKEAADSKVIDLNTQILGTGPFYLAEYVPSVRYVFKRNPGFGQDPRGEVPYVDEILLPVMPEYAAQLAQLRTGGVHLPPDLQQVRPEDILPTKRDVPSLEMLPTAVTTNPRRYIFGQNPDSPFKDERVRQAWSMAQDRDGLNEVFYNVSKFQNEGLPMTTAWSNSAMNADSWNGWWLDPKSKDFGPNAKYFEYNVAEAKKLLSASGFANGVDFNARFPFGGHPYTADYGRTIDVVLGMVADTGFRSKRVDTNFATEFRSVIQRGTGKFDGVSFINASSTSEPVSFLTQAYGAKGGTFYGFDADGKSTYAGDPMMETLLSKMRGEFDDKKRQSLALELQRYDGQKQYYPAIGGGANGFGLAWPAVRGRGVWQGDAYREDCVIWLDQTKAPFTKS